MVLITGSYMLWSSVYTDVSSKQQATDEQLYVVAKNLVLSELIFFVGIFLIPFSDSFSLWNLIQMYLLQDLYFYIVHRSMHTFSLLKKLHNTHHSEYLPVLAWYNNMFEQVFLNLASIAIPFWLSPNPFWVLFLIIAHQIHNSVKGHGIDTIHSVHHSHTNKRFGSLYLLDKILGTY
jgi:methylsterol monooxygenase